MEYSELNPRQKKLALRKWHQRQDAQLSPGEKKALAHKRFLDEEVAPGLTRRDMIQATSSAARQKYGEAGQQLGEDIRQNRLQANRSQGWFQQYQQAIAQAGAAQQANTQAAVQGVQSLQQGLDASSKEAWAGQSAEMSADAANRGATVDPKLADVAHNASNVRNALTGSYGAMLLSQGTNTKNALSDRGLTARQQGIEEQGKFGEAGRKLRGQRVRLKREKGDFKVTYAQQLKAGAEDSALKRALTLAQVGETTADTASKTASAAKTRAETRKTALETAYFERYGKYPSTGAKELDPLEQYRLNYAKTHGGKFPGTESSASEKDGKTDSASGPGSLTPATEQKRVSQVRTVSSLFKNGVVIKDNTGAVLRRIKGGDVEGIRKYLLTEKALDPLAVQIGLALYRNKGRLGRGGVRAAHRYGIHVGGNFEIAKRKPKAASPGAPAGPQGPSGLG